MNIISLSSSLWLAKIYQQDHSHLSIVNILEREQIHSNSFQQLTFLLWERIGYKQRNLLFRRFDLNTKNQIEAWIDWCEESRHEVCLINSYEYAVTENLHLVDQVMNKNAERVSISVKTNINRIREIWIYDDEDEECIKEDMIDYKLWNSTKEEKLECNRLLLTEQITENNFIANKLEFIIFRWVRLSDAEASILLIFELSMKRLHDWWSLDFNTNADSIRQLIRDNMSRTWIRDN